MYQTVLFSMCYFSSDCRFPLVIVHYLARCCTQASPMVHSFHTTRLCFFILFIMGQKLLCFNVVSNMVPLTRMATFLLSYLLSNLLVFLLATTTAIPVFSLRPHIERHELEKGHHDMGVHEQGQDYMGCGTYHDANVPLPSPAFQRLAEHRMEAFAAGFSAATSAASQRALLSHGAMTDEININIVVFLWGSHRDYLNTNETDVSRKVNISVALANAGWQDSPFKFRLNSLVFKVDCFTLFFLSLLSLVFSSLFCLFLRSFFRSCLFVCFFLFARPLTCCPPAETRPLSVTKN